jgi:hypothetical protein
MDSGVDAGMESSERTERAPRSENVMAVLGMQE